MAMLLLLVLAVLSCALAGGADNLLVNGDFERGLEGWQTKSPPGGAAGIEEGPAGKCARLSSTDRSGSTYLIQTLDPARIKGQRLRFGAIMKAENVALGNQSYSQAKATLVWNDGQADHDLEIDFLYTFGWRKIGAVWNVGENCKHATLYLGLHTTTGTVWFDDVTLAVSEATAAEPVAEGVDRTVYDDGVVLRVDGREFTEVQLRLPQDPATFEPTQAETARQFAVFRTENPSAVYPGTVPSRAEVAETLQVEAAPGQYEPVTFCVFALRPLQSVTVTPGELTGPQGATIPATAFDARMARYVMQRVGYTSEDYCVVPKLLVRNSDVSIVPERPQPYWLTLHVPPDTPAGEYKGSVTIEADSARLAVPLTVRVLPVRLSRGKPWMLFFYNNAAQDAELYFRDMREHGMTSVILAQVMAPLRREGDRAVVDFGSSDAFVDAYRKVGFTDPLVYNPFHDRLATILLDQFGLGERFPTVVNYGETIRVFREGEYPPSLHETYRQVVRDIYEHARQTGWPPTVYYPVDEPNDPSDWRMAAARLEYGLTREAVPEARTFCTAYSIPAMELLDPWLDIRACPIGTLVSDEKTHRALGEYLGRAGGEIWGIEWPAMWDDFWRAREIAGLLPAKAGVTGMTAWTYYNPAPFVDEYDDLRGQFKHCLFAYRDADGGLVPTVTWEGIRAGATDWKYLATLEEAVECASGAEQERGRRVLQEALAAIPWRAEGGAEWGNGSATRLRAKVAEEIVRLQGNGDQMDGARGQ